MSNNKSRISLGASKLSNINEIQLFGEQLRKPTQKLNASTNQLIEQNRRILEILKKIQTKIDKELQVHTKKMLSVNSNHKVVFSKDQIKVLQDKQSNNAKLLAVLEKDYSNLTSRRKLYEDGLQQKTGERKYQVQDKIRSVRSELKKLKQEQKQSQRQLQACEDISQAEYLKEYAKTQQQLRVYSSKYVKMLSRHNKVTEQLAVASQCEAEFQIPQQIYDRQMQQKEQTQYKQYKSIVKLCAILSRRNDSQSSKCSRIYAEKLKQLERNILLVAQLEKSILSKDLEVLERRKNIQILKMKLSSHQATQKRILRVTNGTTASFKQQLRQKSYSTAKLAPYPQKQLDTNNKLRTRGKSFVKLPATIKS